MKINNEMTNCSTSNVTAGVLSKNFQKTVEAVVTSNKGFVFTDTIKGTPAFWKRL